VTIPARKGAERSRWAACAVQIAVADGSDYMLHVARVHARRRGWDGSATVVPPEVEATPAVEAPVVPTGCADVALVSESCGGETSTGHPPIVCAAACSRVFIPWFEACAAAASSPDLTAFHVYCLEALGSGH
jgi:hypothetical protein